MRNCWGRIIPARWFKAVRAAAGGGAGLACILLAARLAGWAAAPAAGLEALGRAYWETKTEAARAALARYAAAHPKDRNGALAHFALGWTDLERGKANTAIKHLRAARSAANALADYTSFGVARALLAGARPGEPPPEALAELRAVLAHRPVSVWAESAAIILARALLESGDAAGAAAVLGNGARQWKQPGAYLLLGASYEALGEKVKASIAYQQVYYGQPLSAEAAKAGEALATLRSTLGRDYPPPMPQAILSRAEKLAVNGGANGGREKAIREMEEAIPMMAGEMKDLMRVRIGAVRYMAQENLAALQYLERLRVAPGEVDAERLYYILAAARRLEDWRRMDEVLEQLGRSYPSSRWRMQALIARANQYLLGNQVDAYVPLYRACASGFPGEPEAAYCHWKVAWASYIRREAQAGALLREHLANYPNSEKRWAACYYLGRLEEQRGALPAAKAYYETILHHQPNIYYATAARERLAGAALRQVRAGGKIAWNGSDASSPGPDLNEDATTREILERARLLASAGLYQPAETELYHAGRNGANPHRAAVELAQLASKRGDYAQGIRYFKSLAPDYLGWNPDRTPQTVWRLIFPLPYRTVVERYSRAHGLDPFLVAGLIRQESEFDPRAVSRARAMGLMQILPSTGRSLSRRAGLRRFSTSLLLRPEWNIRLGTLHFSGVLKQLGGNVVAALAAYNAGKSRADQWLQWAEFKEPCEFIETIPFSETRDYVQIVLRNASIYQRLYGRELAPKRAPARAPGPAK